MPFWTPEERERRIKINQARLDRRFIINTEDPIALTGCKIHNLPDIFTWDCIRSLIAEQRNILFNYRPSTMELATKRSTQHTYLTLLFIKGTTEEAETWRQEQLVIVKDRLSIMLPNQKDYLQEIKC